jgi:hypothetical protein
MHLGRWTSEGTGLGAGGRGAAVIADLVGAQVGGPERQRDGEGRSTPGRALGGHGPIVQPDQLLDQRETDAAAFVGAAPGIRDPVGRSNSRGISSAGMPMPVSRTRN